jgi:YidC/Oxa1 family membrane protein insertase
MDRNTLLRWSLIAIAVFVLWKWVIPTVSGQSASVQNVAAETYVNAPDFGPDLIDPVAPGQAPAIKPAEGELCSVTGKLFEAQLSTRGAALTHFFLRDPQYAGSDASDMSTTPDIERWRSLRTVFRSPEANDQLKYDRFNWKLERSSEASCAFTYADEDVRIVKTVGAGERAYELNVETVVTNLADSVKSHQLSIGTFAYRQNHEIKGSLGRVSPFVTELSCARGEKVERKNKDDFKDGWFVLADSERYAAVSNYYFAQAIVPVDGARPTCRMLAEEWVAAGQAKDDDHAGAVYHANLTYPVRRLGTNESSTYKQIAFLGPKDRALLKNAAGGTHGLGDIINLGFFSPVARVLVSALLFIRTNVTFGNWGLAIITLTFGLRLMLFPLTWKSIKTTIEMRKLKPEMDALNKKFPDDAQSRNLATMELYRKHKVNPFGGCLPQLVQMPIWFAMYTTLQTAVEMYHTKFLWFSDLSAPDKFYVLPLVLGAFMIVQQRIVPQQGMDPMQQKMMTYMMPAVFTVMMLFLPAALGVYMLTNSILGISQQLAIEKFAPRSPSSPGGKGDIVVTETPGDSNGGGGGDGRAGAGTFGKGKARV